MKKATSSLTTTDSDAAKSGNILSEITVWHIVVYFKVCKFERYKREEITPHLISVLEKVLQDPEKYADRDSDYWGHIYAFMLLGHFYEIKAHDVIVDLFSLPNDLPSDLFGDSVTIDLPIVLLRTCGGNTERIRDLILNKSAYDYCRGSALQALSYTLTEGYITREEILGLVSLLMVRFLIPHSDELYSFHILGVGYRGDHVINLFFCSDSSMKQF